MKQELESMLSTLNIEMSQSAKCKFILSKYLPREIHKQEILKEILHINQCQEIRKYGMIKDDMNNPDLYEELLKFDIIKNCHWGSLRNYQLIELTPKGNLIASALETSILDSTSIANIKNIELFVVWCNAFYLSGRSPIMRIKFPDEQFRSLLGEDINIISEIPDHSFCIHNEYLRIWQNLSSINLASKAFYYVATRGGEKRNEYFIMSWHTARNIISQITSERIQEITKRIILIWEKYKRKINAYDYLNRIRWGPEKAPSDISDLIKSIYIKMEEKLNLPMPQIDDVLAGNCSMEGLNSNIISKWLEQNRSKIVLRIEEDYEEFLSSLKGNSTITNISSIEPELREAYESDYENRFRRAIIAILRSAPVVSIPIIAERIHLNIEQTREIIFELVSEGIIDAIYDPENDEIRSVQASKLIQEIVSKGSTASCCKYCGGNLGRILLSGDRIECPNCGRVNYG